MLAAALGLPFAIAFFAWEQRKERNNEEEAAYQLLSDAYNDFLKIVLANPDLRLRTNEPLPNPTPEQNERILVIYEMLISLFERAYLLVHNEDMNPKQRRRWNSWEDYMREWCRREDFHNALPLLLRGEDPQFQSYLRRIAQEERVRSLEIARNRAVEEADIASREAIEAARIAHSSAGASGVCGITVMEELLRQTEQGHGLVH